MKRVCLDTSAYSQFKRGAPEAVAAIGQASWVGISTIVLGELRTGFLLGDRTEKNDQELSKLLSHPVVHVLHVDDEASAHYSRLMVSLRRAGTPVPTNDVWVAAVARRENAIVLTFDQHFEGIRDVGTRILGCRRST